jgi:nucleotide-binding universal stress UspA family protein
MKIQLILVPTDFSPAADHAAVYACSLAASSKATILLYHTYHIPVATTEVPVMIVSPEELEHNNLSRLKSYKEDLVTRTGTKLKIECLTTAGFAVEEIIELAHDKNPDLVVMGVSGDGKIGHALLGSVSTGVINKLNVPLLLVPEEAEYKGVSNLAMAYDYHGDLPAATISRLKAFIELFKANLQIVHVGPPNQKAHLEEAVSGIGLEDALNGINHTLHFPENKDVIEGLKAFEEKFKPDMLVMIPRKHSLLDWIFHGSVSKRMAFHTHVPILALHA